jgi:hypothetical protein
MCGLAIGLLAFVFITTLVFPPAAAVTVPACSLVWILACLSQTR